jgi:hypothetical protein
MADKENGGPAAQVTAGVPDMTVVVLDGVSLTRDGKEIKPGKTFVCHGSEAMELAKGGYVDIKGVAKP